MSRRQISPLASQATHEHKLMPDARKHADDCQNERIRPVNEVPMAAQASTPITILTIDPIMGNIPFREKEIPRAPLTKHGDSLPLRHL